MTHRVPFGRYPRLRRRAAACAMCTLMCLCLFACKRDGQIETTTVTEAPPVTQAAFTLPASDPAYDALFAGASGEPFDLPLVSGDLEPLTGRACLDDAVLHTPVFAVPNRVVQWAIPSDLSAMLWRVNPDGSAISAPIQNDALTYLHKNARWAVVIRHADGAVFTETASIAAASCDPANVPVGADGMWTAAPLWGTATSYDGAYGFTAGSVVSIPIPLYDGGLRLLFGGQSAGTFRAVAMRLTDDGAFPAESDTLNRLTAAGETEARSLHLPQTDDTYVVLSLPGDADLTAVSVTGGEPRIGAAEKLPGLMWAQILPKTDKTKVPRIIQFQSSNMWAGQEYLAALLPANAVDTVVCAPRFELFAELWRNKNSTLQYVKTIAGDFRPGSDEPRGAASLTLDEDAGFVFLAVHRIAEPEASGAEVAFKSPGMGGFGGFADVASGVRVTYKTGMEPQISEVEDPRIAQNLEDLSHMSSYAYAGQFSTPQHPTNMYSYERMYVSPFWYNGKFKANTVLHHVTPRSYLTAAKNPNSRCYMFSSDQGYGATCFNFMLSVYGITECYAQVQMKWDNMLKFERRDFSRYTDIESLVPGDILTRINPENQIGHSMAVTQITRFGGQIWSVTVTESWAPFPRCRSFYQTGATDASGTALKTALWSDLDLYTYWNRVRPEYVRRLRDSFDMDPDTTVGTVMCDRGSDSLYCMGAPLAEFSVTDDAATTLYVFCDGQLAGILSLEGAVWRNGCRVVSFAHLLTAPGLYTVITDRSTDVEETFYVPPMTEGFRVYTSAPDAAQKGPTRVVASCFSQLDTVFVYYKKRAGDTSVGPTYTIGVYCKEELTAADPAVYGADRGEIVIPDQIFGYDFSFARVMYRTPYGTFWTGYSKGKLVQSSEYIA